MTINYQTVMRQILASLVHLPVLINGKVIIIVDGKYTKLSVPKTITIADNFDPTNYSVLNDSKWKNLVVYSTSEEKETFLINKVYKEMLSDRCRIGDKIHIHSRNGIYEVLSIDNDTITITCKKWQYDDKKTMIISKTDFKCLAGGLYKYHTSREF